MAEFLDEVKDFFKPFKAKEIKEGVFLQEIIEPENRIPVTANTESKASE